MKNQQKSFRKLVCKTWQVLVSYECKFQYTYTANLHLYMHNLLYIYSTWLCSDPELGSIYALINGCRSVSLSISISLLFMARVWKCFGLIINSNGLQNNLWHIISGHKKVVVIRKSRLCHKNCTWILRTAKKYRWIEESLKMLVDFVAIGYICSSV